MYIFSPHRIYLKSVKLKKFSEELFFLKRRLCIILMSRCLQTATNTCVVSSKLLRRKNFNLLTGKLLTSMHVARMYDGNGVISYRKDILHAYTKQR